MMKIRYFGKDHEPEIGEPTSAAGVSKGLPIGEKMTLIPSSMKSMRPKVRSRLKK